MGDLHSAYVVNLGSVGFLALSAPFPEWPSPALSIASKRAGDTFGALVERMVARGRAAVEARLLRDRRGFPVAS